MSWLLAIALGAGTTGGATASMMSDFKRDIPQRAVTIGFWAVWFGPPVGAIEAQNAVYFGVNTLVWAVAWRQCPTLAYQASATIAMDAAEGFVTRFFARE